MTALADPQPCIPAARGLSLILAAICLVVLLIPVFPISAQPVRLGDFDQDNTATVLDLVRLVNHVNGSARLDSSLLPYSDLNEDGLVNDADVDLLADAVIGLIPLPTPFTAPLVNPPPVSTRSDTVVLTGQSRPNRTIHVVGGQGPAMANPDSQGQFNVSVALQSNRVNVLYVIASNGLFSAGMPQPIRITHDAQPPSLFIDFPADMQALTATNSVVAGRVGDALSGSLGLFVTVSNLSAAIPSGGVAAVDVGLGNNGTFEGAVPLHPGTNWIRVTAADSVGNTATRDLSVIRVDPAGPRLQAMGGDRQAAAIHTRLSGPIVVRATQADGAPFAGKLITMEVTRSDGRLLPVNADLLATDLTRQIDRTVGGTTRLQLFTDTNGEAAAWWTLGGDAGCGNNRVTVSSAGAADTVYFCASAHPRPARQINIGTGDNQRAEAGAPGPEPLRVWVSDSCNGVPGIPVTFRVRRGGGGVAPVETSGAGPGATSVSVTVPTSRTGHAEVLATLGGSPGLNVIEADFPGNPGRPAVFHLSGLARSANAPTAYTGLVLDNAGQPIGGARCLLRVGGRSFITNSDLQGRFRLDNVDAGPGQLHVNGLNATHLNGEPVPVGSFPALAFSSIVVPNAVNGLPAPILLPRLNPNNAQEWDGTWNLVLTCEGTAGLQMTLRAGSMRKPDGTLVTPENPVIVALNQVHHDKVPMPMPDGAAPPFAWTLQPGGAQFDPPIEIEYPNMGGLPAGAIANFLSFNHDTERFEIVGTGHVRPDGSTIVTDPGAGLSVSGWGGSCPPYATTGDVEECDGGGAGAGGGGGFRAAGGGGNFVFVPKDVRYDAKTCEEIEGVGGLGETVFTQPLLEMSCDCDPAKEGERTLAHIAIRLEVYDQWVWANMTDPADTAFVTAHEELHETYAREFFDAAVAAATPIHNRSYPDEESCSDALQQFRDFFWQPALQERDSKDALLDARDKAANRSLRNKYCPPPAPVPPPAGAGLAGQPGPEEPVTDVRVLPGREPWQITVGGQTATLDSLRGLVLQNIPAPDQFRSDGTAGPDGISDDFLRITGTAVSNGMTLYLSSEFFRLRLGRRNQIQSLTVSTAPPPVPESIEATVARASLTFLGETTQVHVAAFYSNGSTNDVTALASGTSYRSSNPSIAAVDDDGLVTAIGPGTVLLTAVNQGATSVVPLEVALRDTFTTLTGFVRNSDGSPAAGRTVRISGQSAAAMTDAAGRFVIPDVNARLGEVRVYVLETINGARWIASVNGLSPVPDGFVDAGVLTLKPALNPTLRGSLAAGLNHTLALRQDGTLWAWGDNGSGQLGDWTESDRPSPTQVGADADWVAVAAGDNHTLAIRADGTLWAWGLNVYGQLGNDWFYSADGAPIQVDAATDWVEVAAGRAHSLALKSNGTLWAAGRNHRGQLGDGSTDQISGFVQVGTETNWSRVAAGIDFTLALRSDGSLWSWGANSSSQLGDGTSSTFRASPARVGTDNDWLEIAGGEFHSLALKTDGSLWSWGSSFQGEAGDPAGATRTSPARIGTNTGWTAIAAGLSHSLALRNDGSLWSWGWNYYGQLGMGTLSDGRTNGIAIGTNTSWIAITAGGYFGVALSSDRRLHTWGANGHGQLGIGRTHLETSPRRVGTRSDWVTARAGRWSNVALDTNGSLSTWGFNYLGELGDGTKTGRPTPIPISPGTNWTDVALTESHTIALRPNGTLWTWGYNGEGQIGDGTFNYRLSPYLVGTNSNWTRTAAGFGHCLAVRTDGTLWAWGLNNSGQLGNGSISRRLTPVLVASGSPSNWLDVAAGTSHSLGLRADGTLWAWGNNFSGQLGGGTNFGTGRQTPAQVGTDTNWIRISGGDLFTLGLKRDGSLWAWGENGDGQLGQGTRTDQYLPSPIGTDLDWWQIDAGDEHALALKRDGSLWAWGNNLSGQIGNGTTSDALAPVRISTFNDWREISAGEDHSLAIRANGELWAWGSNQYGQLGDPVPFSPSPVGTNTNWGSP